MRRTRCPCATTLRRSAEEITIEIADSGPGLPEPPERVFEPYFTTRDTGTGLGLPVARKIVEDHGGRLTATNGVASDNGGGAVFRISLPRHEAHRPKTEEEET